MKKRVLKKAAGKAESDGKDGVGGLAGVAAAKKSKGRQRGGKDGVGGLAGGAAAKKSKGRRRGGKSGRVRLSPARLRALAKGGATVDEAAEQLGIEPVTLGAMLVERKRAGAAWRRGRVLHIVSDLSRSGATRPEVAAALELSVEQFDELLTADAELAGEWIRGRAEYRKRFRVTLEDRALQGNVAALKQIVEEIKAEAAGEADSGIFDIKAVRQEVLTEIVGATRQTIYNWGREDKPIPRNADGTYPLPEVVRWFLSREIAKGSGVGKSGSEDDLRRERIEKLRLENTARRGELLDRRMVVAGYVARAQMLVAWLEGKAAALVAVAQGQPPTKMLEIFEREFADLRRLMAEPPDVLRLSGRPAELLKKLLEMLVCDKREDAA